MNQNNTGFVRFQPAEQISVWRAACALSGQSWAENIPSAATIEKAQFLCQKIVEDGLVVHKLLGPLIGSPVNVAEKWTEGAGFLRYVAYSAEGIGDWNHTRNHLTTYVIAARDLEALTLLARVKSDKQTKKGRGANEWREKVSEEHKRRLKDDAAYTKLGKSDRVRKLVRYCAEQKILNVRGDPVSEDSIVKLFD